MIAFNIIAQTIEERASSGLGVEEQVLQALGESWNAAIEAAAALLEMDDEILPYTIEQVRKLKK